MKTYDIFLFDADGTLFDYDKAEEHALETMFGRCGLSYSEDVRQKYRDINETLWRRLEKGTVTIDELKTLRFDRLFADIGVSLDASEFNSRYLHELGSGTFLIDGAFEICRDLTARGKLLFIVTNGMLATQQSRIEHSQIKDFISDFFVSAHIGFSKPSIEYFDYVFSKLPRVDKSKILIIGDSLSSDVAGGNNAGIDTCWFNETGQANDTGIATTYEIRALSELRRFII